MKCDHTESNVLETRTRTDGHKYRRRICSTCYAEFSTVELPLGYVRDLESEVERLRKKWEALKELLR